MSILRMRFCWTNPKTSYMYGAPGEIGALWTPWQLVPSLDSTITGITGALTSLEKDSNCVGTCTCTCIYMYMYMHLCWWVKDLLYRYTCVDSIKLPTYVGESRPTCSCVGAPIDLQCTCTVPVSRPTHVRTCTCTCTCIYLHWFGQDLHIHVHVLVLVLVHLDLLYLRWFDQDLHVHVYTCTVHVV